MGSACCLFREMKADGQSYLVCFLGFPLKQFIREGPAERSGSPNPLSGLIWGHVKGVEGNQFFSQGDGMASCPSLCSLGLEGLQACVPSLPCTGSHPCSLLHCPLESILFSERRSCIAQAGFKYTIQPERPLTLGPPASTTQMLGFQTCAIMTVLDDSGDRTQGFVYGGGSGQTLPIELHSTSLFIL